MSKPIKKRGAKMSNKLSQFLGVKVVKKESKTSNKTSTFKSKVNNLVKKQYIILYLKSSLMTIKEWVQVVSRKQKKVVVSMY